VLPNKERGEGSQRVAVAVVEMEVEDPKKDVVMKDMYVAEEQTTTESRTANQALRGNDDRKEAARAPCLGLDVAFILAAVRTGGSGGGAAGERNAVKGKSEIRGLVSVRQERQFSRRWRRRQKREPVTCHNPVQLSPYYLAVVSTWHPPEMIRSSNLGGFVSVKEKKREKAFKEVVR
jgi:hypothetical protein